MKRKQRRTYKIADLYGVFGPLIALVCIFIAIYYAPWFSFTGNWLSDLGGNAGDLPIWAARGTISIYFNVGLIIAGLSEILFAIDIRTRSVFKPHIGHFGIKFLLLDAVALTTIGIFPQTLGLVHYIAAGTFFFLVPAALIPTGMALIKLKERKFGAFTIFLGVISLASLVLLIIPKPWGQNAIAELFPIVAISLFIAVYSTRFLSTESI